MSPNRSERRPLVSCSPWVLLAVLVSVAAMFAWKLAAPFLQRVNDPKAEPRVVTPRGDLAADEQSTIALFKNASPSVVHITTTERRYADIFRMRAMEVPQGSGSGFVWDDRGYIVTNFHVVGAAARAFVALDDHTVFQASLVGWEPEYDIAVLKIDAPRASIPALPVGTSDGLQVGQKVFAIGNPFGLDHTLTTGIISGLGREILSVAQTPIRNVIQTDAAINPGNSGGPLLDSSGRLIGINTAIYSTSGGSAGIGFAVPVDTINAVVPALIRMGRFTPPRLGVTAASEQVARLLKVTGVVVDRIEPGSAAEKAGMRAAEYTRNGSVAADVITAVDGQSVSSITDIRSVMLEHRAGEEIPVEILRDGRKITLNVKLEE